MDGGKEAILPKRKTQDEVHGIERIPPDSGNPAHRRPVRIENPFLGTPSPCVQHQKRFHPIVLRRRHNPNHNHLVIIVFPITGTRPQIGRGQIIQGVPAVSPAGPTPIEMEITLVVISIAHESMPPSHAAPRIINRPPGLQFRLNQGRPTGIVVNIPRINLDPLGIAHIGNQSRRDIRGVGRAQVVTIHHPDSPAHVPYQGGDGTGFFLGIADGIIVGSQHIVPIIVFLPQRILDPFPRHRIHIIDHPGGTHRPFVVTGQHGHGRGHASGHRRGVPVLRVRA